MPVRIPRSRVSSKRRAAAALTASALVALTVSAATSISPAAAATPPAPPAPTYTNPVSDGTTSTFPDPTTIRGKDGYWYAYSSRAQILSNTGDTTSHRMGILRSADQVHWTYVGDVFPGDKAPSWQRAGSDSWAPDIRYLDGRYVLYYSVANPPPGSNDYFTIAAATAPTPAGPWTDSGGPVIPAKGACDTFTDIDPSQITDAQGQKWLQWGSFRTLCIAKLDEAGLRVTGPVKTIWNGAVEGGYITRHDGWYYLFGSENNCCIGADSSYQVRVGRSRTVDGPYVDNEGIALTETRSKGTFVVSNSGNRFVGPGHMAVSTDRAGQDWMVYHAVPRDHGRGGAGEPDLIRPLMIDRLDWIDGWPVLRAGAGASDTAQPAPVETRAVGSGFNDGAALATGWDTTGSAPAQWTLNTEADSKRFATHPTVGSAPALLLTKQELEGDRRAEADVRQPATSTGAAGLVVNGRTNDRSITAWVDAGRKALVVTQGKDDKQTVLASSPLPTTFRYDTWHTVAAELRGVSLHVDVTDAGQHDPVAELVTTLNASDTRKGRIGAAFRGTGGDADEVGATRLFTPVTRAVAPPVRGSLDPAYSDEFDGTGTPGTTPQSPWTWVRRPVGALADGSFAFPTTGELYRGDNTASVLTRAAPAGNYTVETKFDFDGSRGAQQAGLAIYAGDDRYLKLTNLVLDNGGTNVGQQHLTSFAKDVGTADYTESYVGPPAGTMWMRIIHTVDKVNGEDEYRAATSRDGVTWVYGATWVLGTGTSARIALVSLNAPGATAKFDYVRTYRPSVNDSAYTKQVPPLTTPWTDAVTPDNALPDYPRPQLTRPDWQNLNGVWEFSRATVGESAPFGKTLNERILVPYPVESALSGIMRHEEHMWYRRTFTVPAGWNVGDGKRLQMHFGAVDHSSTVWVNGTQVATHKGGYGAFTADVTDALVAGASQEVVVGVDDPTDAGWQPIGKQRQTGGGIFYTPTSGIWQTVWLEPTAAAHIDRLDLTPDLGSSSLKVAARTSGVTGQTVEAVAYSKGVEVGRITGPADAVLTLPVANPHLWSPKDPYLYDLKVRLLDGTTAVDSVQSYFGMRSISLGKTPDGKNRMLLNGRFVTQVGPLDQGFWPDGVYTAPTDDALKFDLEQEKALGFNMVRKHIKVEPDRWYYWADKLGLLVWQDMPAMNVDFSRNRADNTPPVAAQEQYIREAKDMVDRHKSFTSIVTWVPMNEGWGEWSKQGTGDLADQFKAWDPSRLVNAHSGVNCCNSLGDSGKGDIYDDHSYVGPGGPRPTDTRAAVDGEYGGLGLKTPGHEYAPDNSFSYELEPDSTVLTDRYVAAQNRLVQAVRGGVSAGVYTETTDVEYEINGFYTYDRRVLKMDADRVKAVNRKLIDLGDAIASGGDSGPVVPPGTPGLKGIAAYSFDENAGTVAHDNAGTHDATLKNGASWTTGKAGSALNLAGGNQFADTGATLVDTVNSYSISAWVKLNNPGGAFETIASQDGDRNSAFFLQYSGADRRLAFSFIGTRALAPTSPEAGRWYHVVGVRDAAQGVLKLYIDGQLVDTRDASIADPSSGHTVIGRGQFDGNPVDYLNGSLDDVRIFDRAVSATEVGSLYAAGGVAG